MKKTDRTAPRKAHAAPRKAAVAPRKAAIAPRKAAVVPRKAAVAPRKSSAVPRKVRGTSRRAQAATRAARTAPAVPSKWVWHHRTLVKMRDQLLRERTDHLQDALAPIEPHSTHFADSATDEFDHDVTLAILRREENALREVEEAIERIHAGTYGICTVTMMPIPAQRLHALPWCRYALATERELEKNRAIMPTRVPPAVSLRGPTAGIPYSGTLSAEGMENEPVEREEPKAGRATTDSLPLDEDE